MTKISIAVLFAVLASVPASVIAQRQLAKTNTTRGTATIQAIDHTTRAVTLRLKDGTDETLVAGPEIARFNELKVGDTVNMTYVESLVVQVHKPGDDNVPSGTASDIALTRGRGPRPAGTIGQQVKTAVTVKAVNPSMPSITVLTADGHTVTRKIEDRKNLDGVKPGDKLEITYTEALLMALAPVKR
jgi:Cu/Ag efflux protein CusF